MTTTENGSLLDSDHSRSQHNYGATDIVYPTSPHDPVQQTEKLNSKKKFRKKQNFYDDEDGTWESIACYLASMNSSSCLNLLVNGALTILVPFFVAEILHETKSMMGFIFFLSYLADIICIPPAGIVTSKYGSIVSLIIVTIMKSLAYAVLFLSVYFNIYQLYSLMICSVILGASEAWYSLGYMAFTSKYVYTNKRGRFNTYVSALKRLGFLLGTFSTGYIIQYTSIETTLMILTVVCVISIFCIILLLTPPKYTNDHELTFDGSMSSLRRSYSQKKIRLQRLLLKVWVSPKERQSRNPNQPNTPDESLKMINIIKKHWLVLFNITIYSFGMTYMRNCRKIIMTFQALDIGLTASEIGWINAMSYVPDIALFYVAGYLMDKYGRRYTMIPSLTFFMISNFIVSWMTSFNLLLLNAMLFGISDGFATGLISTIGSDIAPKYCRGKFLTIYNLLAISANVISPLITGYLSHKYNSTKIAGFVAAGFGLIALLWVIFFIPDPKHEQKKYNKISDELNKKETNEDIDAGVQA